LVRLVVADQSFAADLVFDFDSVKAVVAGDDGVLQAFFKNDAGLG
jgi:hypothetical protein